MKSIYIKSELCLYITGINSNFGYLPIRLITLVYVFLKSFSGKPGGLKSMNICITMADKPSSNIGLIPFILSKKL